MTDRHIRQTRLREIGDGGQRRIGAATAVVVSRGFAGEIEARYLAGAGFARIVVPDDRSAAAARAVDPNVAIERRDAAVLAATTPFDGGLTDPGARTVAEGAYRALVAIRAAIGDAEK